MEIKSILVEPMSLEDGPFGAKEGGESTLISAVPAIANAIYDAIGVRLTSLPITPDNILKALEDFQKGGSGDG